MTKEQIIAELRNELNGDITEERVSDINKTLLILGATPFSL